MAAHEKPDVFAPDTTPEGGVAPIEVEVLPSVTRPKLPIQDHLDEILLSIHSNRVTVIEGETGCGKSSQVPQFILDDALEDPDSRTPYIIVTQPRRIAAISLAKRVADERGEVLGQSIGYIIGQDRVGSHETCVYFCTAGWLLQKLLFSRDFLRKTTHIIMDEIHERSIDADLLYLMVKMLMLEGLSSGDPEIVAGLPKLVLMSATFNTTTFCNYFNLDASRPPRSLFVGAHRFPVQLFFLEELPGCGALRTMKFAPNELWNAVSDFPKKIVNATRETQSSQLREKLQWIGTRICLHLCREYSSQPDGNCILVFLAGLSDIEDMGEDLSTRSRALRIENLEIVTLHSVIEHEDQMKAFAPIPPGVTRVVLATNIAESSVTIPQVRFVLDYGLVKQVHHDPRFGCESLISSYVAKSSAMQRSGRAGRLFPGTVFRMYPRAFFDHGMQEYDQPEMLRLSLSTTVLRLKELSEAIGDKGSPISNPYRALGAALQPPHASKIDSAFAELLEVGALVQRNPGEIEYTAEEELWSGETRQRMETAQSTKLSSLGSFLLHLPFDMPLGKLVAYGAHSGRLFPHTLVMAVGLSMQEIFCLPNPNAIESIPSHVSILEETFKGRDSADNGMLSEAMAVLTVYNLFVSSRSGRDTRIKQWGVHLPRLKSLVRQVGEIARRVVSVMPHFEHVCRNLASSRMVLPLEAGDIAMLRLLMVRAFKRNLLYGTLTRGDDPHGVGSDGLVLGAVPQPLLSEERLRGALGPLSDHIKGISFGAAKAKKKKSKMPHFYKNGSITLEFHPRRPRARPPPAERGALGEYVPGLRVPSEGAYVSSAFNPFGEEVLPEEEMSADKIGDSLQRTPMGARVMCCLFGRSGLELWNPERMLREQGFAAIPEKLVIGQPQRRDKCDWRFLSPAKGKSPVAIRSAQSLLSWIGPSAKSGLNTKGVSVVALAVWAMVSGNEKNPSFSCERFTVIPEEGGFLALCLLLLFPDAVPLFDFKYDLLTAVSIPSLDKRIVLGQPIPMKYHEYTKFWSKELEAVFDECDVTEATPEGHNIFHKLGLLFQTCLEDCATVPVVDAAVCRSDGVPASAPKSKGFACPFPGCDTVCGKEEELKNHEAKRHRKGPKSQSKKKSKGPQHVCSFCNVVCGNEDDLERHIGKKHKQRGGRNQPGRAKGNYNNGPRGHQGRGEQRNAQGNVILAPPIQHNPYYSGELVPNVGMPYGFNPYPMPAPPMYTGLGGNFSAGGSVGLPPSGMLPPPAMMPNGVMMHAGLPPPPRRPAAHDGARRGRPQQPPQRHTGGGAGPRHARDPVDWRLTRAETQWQDNNQQAHLVQPTGMMGGQALPYTPPQFWSPQQNAPWQSMNMRNNRQGEYNNTWRG